MRRKKDAVHIFCGTFQPVFQPFPVLTRPPENSNIHA